MKKFSLVMAVFMLMITILSSSAMAAELEPIEVGPYPGNDITSQINLNSVYTS